MAQTPNPDKILRNQRFNLYPLQAWYCLALFIFLVGCFQWGALLHSKFIRHGRQSEHRAVDRLGKTMTSGHHKDKDAEAGAGRQEVPTRHGVSFRRVPLAIINAYRVVAFRWTLKIGQSYTLSVAEVSISIAYIAFLLIWTFINTTDVEGYRLDLNYWSQRAGILAASQFPLVTALGTKNNIVSLVTGVSFEKLNYVHRTVARSLMVLLWIHGGSEVYAYTAFTQRIHMPWLRIGITALAALTLLCLVSLRPARQGAYEIFFYMHFILVLIILIGAYFHTMEDQVSIWIWPCFLFWALDRFIRFVRLVLFNHSYFRLGFLSGSGARTMDATTELLAENVVRLRLRRPSHFHWRAGQIAYLTMPSVSRLPFESHPFTIASIDSSSFYPEPSPSIIQSDSSIKAQDEDGASQKASEGHQSQLEALESPSSSAWKELVFIINVRKGFTKRLGEVAARKEKVKVLVDGPYGLPFELGSYDTSILVAGGSGVSYTLPIFLDVVERVRNGKSDCRRAVFVWIIRDGRHIQWIQDALAKAVQIAPSSLTVSILIHITNPRAQIVTPSGESESVHTVSEGQARTEKPLGDSQFNTSIPGLNIVHGRPDIEKLFQEETVLAVGSMSVNVCGSQGIVQSVRSALAFPVSSPLNVMRGGPSVTLHVESFGYA
ncbi:ferric reductase NAD binding domain-containing protein [Hygrophoropsis aurantiaca]|uniref:Ferric reductase NAD binding domain-containing protein n=1 Tax=Hygrophoropsis aurantiaca TaxID=72124 RepID=A0ACB8A8C6_9AGAM|nr:ferric reductase NAD binding domain-containing protein [Hygrophoropsis aurantiaca]